MDAKHLSLLSLMILQLILSQTPCLMMAPDHVDVVSDESSSQQFSHEFEIVSKRVSPAPPPPTANRPVQFKSPPPPPTPNRPVKFNPPPPPAQY
ncbi:hypothetical protein OWV82_007655 [Melia azedarach]|uniref:Uncharacterized protein n=1 Tax=Melia azedarach TaxID=155640 RepID=A0ACC1Y821_MELAZ|nr:hypothetical protein OWV82_007655 [Melia azedarach]